MSHFIFLKTEWPQLFESASRAESLAYPDPRAACFYARHCLEQTVHWLFTYDTTLQRRSNNETQLNALLHEASFKHGVGREIFDKTRVIQGIGNNAVHSGKAISANESAAAVRELFHITYWLARHYARGTKPSPTLTFQADKLPRTSQESPQSREKLQSLELKLRERDLDLAALVSDKSALNAELEKLRAEIAAAKLANAAIPDTHDYSEALTRDLFIDLLLREAGWALEQSQDREFKVTGMPTKSGIGYVDYVLWGDDGKPLAVVEAKATKADATKGRTQAKLYADCLEQQFGQRPIIFYTNGYEHWIWDDKTSPPRRVQGFYRKSELELLIQRRQTRKSLLGAPINSDIVERHYQQRAITRIGEALEREHQRKALVVMATGAGKTRTVIALVDQLLRCNWVKRVLFLADRVALVKQAAREFLKHLPDSAPVNLVSEREGEGRVYVSTYPTMMGLIDETRNGERRFGVGHFDLVIIDEAHRSVFQRYRAIFDYFDSYLVGLTATPRDEIDRNTYGLFDLEDGFPTDAYALDEAVKDGFLVPPKAVSVPLRFQRGGIKYNDLLPEEKDQWDALDWDDPDGAAPDFVDPEALNRWLFNQDTVDKALEYLMTRGLKVAGGDRLGKTIIFARNNAHAEYIKERFDANYPQYKGAFAEVITYEQTHAQSLIDSFSKPESAPHIAISVDMLDTGIDVPEVVNLLFFKPVRSKTKFWQMVGRGTRLCRDLFGPGLHKKFFYLFDLCQNLEFFSQNPETADTALPEPLSQRLFKARLEVVSELNHRQSESPPGLVTAREHPGSGELQNESDVRTALLAQLRTEVAAMNVENFLVRPKRRSVEKFTKPEAWTDLTEESVAELSREVAGLPSELEAEPVESKLFDLTVLRLQLALLKHDGGYKRWRDQVVSIARQLQDMASIPMVKEQLALIEEVQTEAWWQDVTVPMLEQMRRRLRRLVQLIEKKERKILYTNFIDELGTGDVVPLQEFGGGDSFEAFKERARAFLRSRQNDLTIYKLRMNEPLTATDLAQLERILKDNGIAHDEDLRRATEETHGLGLFVRSLVGLDREAAKRALGSFLSDLSLSGDQIEFVNLVVEHLTHHGVMERAQLYESPFTDNAPTGPQSLFPQARAEELLSVLDQVKARAVA